MAISIADLMKVGDNLHKQAEEPPMRSGVSRHYYAAYHRCDTWHKALPAQGHPNVSGAPKGGVHQQLINALKNPDPSLPLELKNKSRKIGAKLDILRGRRHVADYELASPVLPTDGSIQQAQACSLIAYCDQP